MDLIDILSYLNKITFQDLINDWKFHNWVETQPKYSHVFWNFDKVFKFYQPKCLMFDFIGFGTFVFDNFNYDCVQSLNSNVTKISIKNEIKSVCINIQNSGSIVFKQEDIININYCSDTLSLDVSSNSNFIQDLQNIKIIADDNFKNLDIMDVMNVSEFKNKSKFIFDKRKYITEFKF